MCPAGSYPFFKTHLQDTPPTCYHRHLWVMGQQKFVLFFFNGEIMFECWWDFSADNKKTGVGERKEVLEQLVGRCLMHRAETMKVLETSKSTKSRCYKCECGMNSLCFRFFSFCFQWNRKWVHLWSVRIGENVLGVEERWRGVKYWWRAWWTWGVDCDCLADEGPTWGSWSWI